MPIVETTRGVIWTTDHLAFDPALPTLILIHGAYSTHIDWRREVLSLDWVNVLAFDLPGHGQSEGDARSSVTEYAADVVALMDALNIDRAYIGGHSLGGAIAQTLALDYPARVQGLVLVCTGAKLPVHADVLSNVVRERERIIDLILSWMWADDADSALVAENCTDMLAVNPHSAALDFQACSSFDSRQRLHAIAVPTLIIGTGDDRMTPFKFSATLHASIPGSTLIRVEGGTHMVVRAEPDLIAALIADWFEDRE